MKKLLTIIIALLSVFGCIKNIVETKEGILFITEGSQNPDYPYKIDDDCGYFLVSDANSGEIADTVRFPCRNTTLVNEDETYKFDIGSVDTILCNGCGTIQDTTNIK